MGAPLRPPLLSPVVRIWIFAVNGAWRVGPINVLRIAADIVPPCVTVVMFPVSVVVFVRFASGKSERHKCHCGK